MLTRKLGAALPADCTGKTTRCMCQEGGIPAVWTLHSVIQALLTCPLKAAPYRHAGWMTFRGGASCARGSLVSTQKTAGASWSPHPLHSGDNQTCPQTLPSIL